MFRIEGDVLVPGRGEPITNGCVVVEDESIVYAGTIEGAPKAPKSVSVPAVMPGMWDVHGHFFGLRTGNAEEFLRTPLAVLAARIAADAQKGIEAGFTSVREPGGLGVHLARATAEGTVVGPHIYAAGAALSQTGGHGDIHAYPLDFMEHAIAHQEVSRLCDGVPEVLKGVREQLRKGAKLIKVLASGGIMSELDNPVHQQFTDEELAAIVKEAGRQERIVAAHCHGKAGIVAALKAGCRTIEHGSYLDDESAEMMIEREAVLVPTRFVLVRAMKLAKEAGVPDYARQKLAAMLDRHEESLHLAVRKGVRIALGTDIINTWTGSPAPWGMNAMELVHLAGAGMSPLRAIEAATANGPLTLGPQAPRSGQLRQGWGADVLAVAKNPLADLASLAEPGNITHVWKSGVLVKRPPM